jgi:hypothetical protein
MTDAEKEVIIERLDVIGRKWLDSVKGSQIGSVPKTLYHYTNSAGLFGMLKEGRIWLTDSRFLNDKTEGLHFVSLVKGMVAKLLSGEKDGVLVSFYESILERIDSLDTYNAYIFSLSTRRDDLSQWRGYANEGSGFTIGFSGMDLHGRADDKDTPLNFAKVVYELDAQSDIIANTLTQLREQLVKELANLSDDAEKASIADEAARTFAWIVDNQSIFFKHHSFSSEGEWRLVIYRRAKSSTVLVRPSGSSLVPYIEIEPMGPSTKLPVTELGIGPGFESLHIGDAVEALCRHTGYTPLVYSAETPYRRN